MHAPTTTKFEISHPERASLRITTDPAAVDIDAVHAFLTTAYWCEGISRELVARAAAGSIAFSMFDGNTQIGFARVITDCATYAYLADVYVLDTYRGHGLGKWLVATIMSHPDLQGLRRFSLATRDAHTLYAAFGFTPLNAPDRHMEIVKRNPYKAT